MLREEIKLVEDIVQRIVDKTIASIEDNVSKAMEAHKKDVEALVRKTLAEKSVKEVKKELIK